ncbi:iron-containing redox enzyme family protein [Streptomyces sp. NBC_01387]|uniref:iron-containing redox enzyme family protein n=1 Tax=unclassified Streptomyces TaxID=2593676 RepID=UPI00224E682F|nr:MULTISPECIES: iron-containing redox enzyme family protein [unclassified Streptomyces]MCX4553511.1 iron-containing redox enzyme family protein [Streptomyces sp. NBC_01500]WSC18463.1 iron-containing redox enzyme family protein [Streptomyces sp. NBC_01766]WSV52504.1 iron-containing redox enzyme family protein [Streptomyces sp. NBC_01014]
MSPSAVASLRLELSLVQPVLRASAARVWRSDSGLPGRYRHYLCAMHQVIRASVPLMERAAARCEALSQDPVAPLLTRYLRAHAEEERGHDDWLLADAAATGTAPGELTCAVPPAHVAALVGAQYYWLEHSHPVALLGYIAVLEGNAPAPGLAGRLERETGLPQAAFETVRLHADLDDGHGADLDRLLDRLPLDAAQRSLVAVSALHTVAALTELFDRIAAAPTVREGAHERPRT